MVFASVLTASSTIVLLCKVRSRCRNNAGSDTKSARTCLALLDARATPGQERSGFGEADIRIGLVPARRVSANHKAPIASAGLERPCTELDTQLVAFRSVFRRVDMEEDSGAPVGWRCDEEGRSPHV